MKAGKKAGSAIFAGLLMASAGVASAQVIRLHDAADYQGANVDIINEVSDLSSVGFSSRAKSATVLGGAWLACRAPYLSGPCVVVREPASNFGMFGMSNAIQSVTPLPAVITYEHGTVFSRDSLGNVIFYRPTGETSVTPIGSTSPPPPAPRLTMVIVQTQGRLTRLRRPLPASVRTIIKARATLRSSSIVTPILKAHRSARIAMYETFGATILTMPQARLRF